MVSLLSKTRVVLVEPLYPVNLGSVARALKNFGCRELVLVRPKAQKDAMAQKYAKRAWSLLEKARVVGTLEEALDGCDGSAATTGVTRRFHKRMKHCWSVKEFAEKIGAKDKIALVFGNEGTGLSEADLEECDAILTIPASKKYPVLNLSHAVAVVLYELACGRKRAAYYKTADRKSRTFLAQMLGQIARELPEVRDKKKIAKAFRSVLGRARPSQEEVQSLFAVLGPIRRRLKAAGK